MPFFLLSFTVNFAKFDLLLISIHLFSLQMLLFHPNLIIAIVFFTAYLIPPLNVIIIIIIIIVLRLYVNMSTLKRGLDVTNYVGFNFGVFTKEFLLQV